MIKKRYFKFILFLFLALFIANKFFYYDLDAPDKCVIQIVPSFLPSNMNTKNVLKLIKESSPEDYKLVCDRVNRINKNPGCGGFDGGCFYQNKPKTIYIGNDQGNITLAAALVMHETCHAVQFQDGRQMTEGECYKIGSQFLEKITIY